MIRPWVWYMDIACSSGTNTKMYETHDLKPRVCVRHWPVYNKGKPTMIPQRCLHENRDLNPWPSCTSRVSPASMIKKQKTESWWSSQIIVHNYLMLHFLYSSITTTSFCSSLLTSLSNITFYEPFFIKVTWIGPFFLTNLLTKLLNVLSSNGTKKWIKKRFASMQQPHIG